MVKEDESINLEGSYLGERGYTGYSRVGCDIRGYVHGNIDAIASASGKNQSIGNQWPPTQELQHTTPHQWSSHLRVFHFKSHIPDCID